jgi:hypothetical protein
VLQRGVLTERKVLETAFALGPEEGSRAFV